jgi:predicted dehydrogenase
MKDIAVGVIGCGYWGPNLIRNFSESVQTDVKYACDLRKDRCENIKLKYPQINMTRRYRDILKDPQIEAVAISTPVSSHYKIVREALEAGKHVLVEKPLSSNSKEAEILVNIASAKGLVLLVDHIFIYTNAVKKIREYISKGSIGKLYYFDSVRINLGLFQKDVNVIWDLAPHDLAIMDYLIPERPVSITATGASHTRSGLEDMAYITVDFNSSFIAHFHVNWMSPVKMRRIMIGGSKRMMVYDDLDPAEKLKIYDKGVKFLRPDRNSLYRSLIQYRIGDVYSPSIDNAEALKSLIEHFVDCIKNNKKPVTDGMAGLQVVRMLEAAERSLRKGGMKVRL